ncbi:hypothetical protein D3C81_1653570 [compost metagenome]
MLDSLLPITEVPGVFVFRGGDRRYISENRGSGGKPVLESSRVPVCIGEDVADQQYMGLGLFVVLWR